MFINSKNNQLKHRHTHWHIWRGPAERKKKKTLERRDERLSDLLAVWATVSHTGRRDHEIKELFEKAAFLHTPSLSLCRNMNSGFAADPNASTPVRACLMETSLNRKRAHKWVKSSSDQRQVSFRKRTEGLCEAAAQSLWSFLFFSHRAALLQLDLLTGPSFPVKAVIVVFI